MPYLHSSKLPRLTAVVGPTASGKTSLGATWAGKVGGAVISADSRQIYVGMDIGTASPLPVGEGRVRGPHGILEPDMIDGVPHYLLNVARPDAPWSLAQWQAAAFTVVDSLIEHDTSPLLVGGTMLYAASIAFNYALPEVPPNPALRAELEQRSVDELYAELLEKDPSATDFIEPGNKRRIIRALEVIAATGEPFSKLRQQRPARYDVRWIGLFPGWEELTRRIKERATAMLEAGLLNETRALAEQYGEDLPLLKTMHYKQARAVLQGEMTEEAALAEMVRANVRYARRQMSWWRGREEIRWFSSADEAMKHVSFRT